VPKHYNSFNQTFLEISLHEKKNKIPSTKRMLADLSPLADESVKMNFKWNITDFSSRKVQIKIDFDEPLEVSNEVRILSLFNVSLIMFSKLTTCK
jgi:hypothetical protein